MAALTVEFPQTVWTVEFGGDEVVVAPVTMAPGAPGGGGAVDSVNGQTGTVVLDLDDLTDVDTTTDPPDADDVLAWDGTLWTPAALTAADTGAIPASLIDAKGDVIVGTAADTAARLGVGADGQVLTADSTQASGVKWAAAAGGGGIDGWYNDSLYSPLFGTVHCQIGGGGAATPAYGANTLILWRILAVDTVDIDGVMAMVYTAGAGGEQVRFGIYDSGASTAPSGVALVDSGPMSVSSGHTLISATFSAVRLQPNRPMWAALLTSSATATFRWMASGWDNTTQASPLDVGIAGTNMNTLRRATGVTFGALPTAPSAPFTNSTNVIPGVFWRTRTV